MLTIDKALGLPLNHQHDPADIVGGGGVSALTTADRGSTDPTRSVAPLEDTGGGVMKVPVTYLPNSVMEYKGTWDATTNITSEAVPKALVDGDITANAGDTYIVSVAGVVDFDGAGGRDPISFNVNDWVIYDGALWQKSNASQIASDVTVVQAHDFVKGESIYNNGGTWTRAQSNNKDTLGIAIVSSTGDGATYFALKTYGDIHFQGGHAFGANIGEYLYTSAAVAGALTPTEPQGLTLFSNPMVHVHDANTLTVIPIRPTPSIPRGNDIRHITVTADYEVEDVDESIFADATLGPIIIYLKQGADYDGFTLAVKKIDNTANTVTVKSDPLFGGSGDVEFVIGTTGHVIYTRGHAYKYSSDGTNYYIMA